MHTAPMQPCEHCAGIIRHEPWCISRNELLVYADEALLDASKLSLGDQLMLHALGVVWSDNVCKGNCQAMPRR